MITRASDQSQAAVEVIVCFHRRTSVWSGADLGGPHLQVGWGALLMDILQNCGSDSRNFALNCRWHEDELRNQNTVKYEVYRLE